MNSVLSRMDASLTRAAGVLIMRVTVKVAPEVARSLTKSGSPGKSCSELSSLLNSLSVRLVPLHPGADDDTLGSYFGLDVPDHKTAERIVKCLRPCKGIRAAYVKPVDALP
jgi:hypothetical protein